MPKAWPLSRIAEEVGTPFYCYSTANAGAALQGVLRRLCRYRRTCLLCVEANSNQAVIATLARLGSGADVVSAGELARALRAGFPAGKIMFSGVGKTARELDAGIAATSFASMSSLYPSCTCFRRGRLPQGARHASPSGSTRMSMPGPHAKIFDGQEAGQVGIPWEDAMTSMRWQPPCRGYRSPGRHAYREPDHRA